jgi:hypothetical protein
MDCHGKPLGRRIARAFIIAAIGFGAAGCFVSIGDMFVDLVGRYDEPSPDAPSRFFTSLGDALSNGLGVSCLVAAAGILLATWLYTSAIVCTPRRADQMRARLLRHLGITVTIK